MENKILVTVTGPSLTGKTTFAHKLFSHDFAEVVSTTTRPPRKGEIDGIHYHFVTKEEFKKISDAKGMIESVTVNGNFYGVTKKALDEVFKSGKNAVLVVEPNGSTQVKSFCKKHNIPVFSVFLNNPTKLLVERFLGRYKQDSLAKDDVYADRIIHMLTTERNDWIIPAYTEGSSLYDKVFDSFTENNEDDVVSALLSEVAKKMEVRKNNTPKR